VLLSCLAWTLMQQQQQQQQPVGCYSWTCTAAPAAVAVAAPASSAIAADPLSPAACVCDAGPALGLVPCYYCANVRLSVTPGT
jgi:hypothetical protein